MSGIRTDEGRFAAVLRADVGGRAAQGESRMYLRFHIQSDMVARLLLNWLESTKKSNFRNLEKLAKWQFVYIVGWDLSPTFMVVYLDNMLD